MSFQSSRIDRNVVPKQQDRSKCRPGATGYIKMSFQSMRIDRNVVPEQQDKSKCRPGGCRIRAEIASNATKDDQDGKISLEGRQECRQGRKPEQKPRSKSRGLDRNLFLDT